VSRQIGITLFKHRAEFLAEQRVRREVFRRDIVVVLVVVITMRDFKNLMSTGSVGVGAIVDLFDLGGLPFPLNDLRLALLGLSRNRTWPHRGLALVR